MIGLRDWPNLLFNTLAAINFLINPITHARVFLLIYPYFEVDRKRMLLFAALDLRRSNVE